MADSTMKEPTLDLSPSPGDEVKTTTCYMCACRCGIKVWLRDGKIRYIQGNPEHPVNRACSARRARPGSCSTTRRRGWTSRCCAWASAARASSARSNGTRRWRSRRRGSAPIRERNPDELAFFTGRDQSQALTGWWAQQFGTVNYAAHGGFCSVNMAAGGLYTLGGCFWEFGEPDWEHAKYLMMWGVAEDHDSNPIKLGLGKLKARGAKIVAVNPVRTGYGAIADEWIGIRPGTDGLFAFALIHELLNADRIDLDYLVRYTNAHWLVIAATRHGADDGLFVRDADGKPLCWSTSARNAPRDADAIDVAPAVVGEVTLARRPPRGAGVPPDRRALPRPAVFARCGQRTLRHSRRHDPPHRARAGRSRLRQQAITLPIAWTDAHGREHADMIGRPVAMHAMRGISAHSNGFHTCRALHLLQLLLGAVDTPGSFRYQPPFPQADPAGEPPRQDAPGQRRARRRAAGFRAWARRPASSTRTASRAASTTPSRGRYPLAAHGMMHTRDPQRLGRRSRTGSTRC